jgi:phosphoglucosamine mutase
MILWQLAERIFSSLRAETYVINNTPNGLNINASCGSTHIEGLQAFVRENKLDAGFALDGDADRCLAVDENGEIIDGDRIIYIYGCYLKELGKLKNNTVVTTIMSNFGLYKALDEVGICYEKTAVGDKYVFENMKQNGHIVGGEQSGHIIFGEYANTGDGLLTALQLLQVMLESGKKLSELAAPMTPYPQVLKNVEVTDKDLTLADPGVCAAVRTAETKLGSEGRVLLRKSGTEPVLRVMSEAKNHAVCEEQVDVIIDAMRAGGFLIKIR